MKKGIKNYFQNAVLVIFTFAVSGIAAEFIYSKLTQQDDSDNFVEWTCGKSTRSLVGGYKPNCKGRWALKDRWGSFDTTFTTDEFGRRVVLNKTKSPGDSGQLFLFGGSDVLGKGVNDGETIASQLAPLTDFAVIKNYGGPGFGAQHILELLQFSDLTKEAPPNPEKNVGLFFYVDDQVNRTNGTWAIATEWGSQFPYYALDSEDKLVFKGTFESGHRYSPLLLLAKKSVLLDTLMSKASSYLSFSDADIRLTAKILAAIKEEFVSKYKNGKFYVVINPITKKSAPRLRTLLNEFGVDIIDHTKVWDPADPANQIPEGHPSPIVYQLVAQQLAKDLKNLK